MLHESWPSRGWNADVTLGEVNNNQSGGHGHEEGGLKREWDEGGSGGGGAGPRYQELRPYNVMKHEYSPPPPPPPPRAHDYRRDLTYDAYLEPYGELEQ